MLPCFAVGNIKNSQPIKIVRQSDYPTWLASQTDSVPEWLNSLQFKAELGKHIIVPTAAGKILFILICVSDKGNFWNVGYLPCLLPEGIYHFEKPTTDLAIAWGLGAYQFTDYKKPQRAMAKLFLPPEIKSDYINNIVESIYLVRNLINIPTDDMGPSELALAAKELGKTYKVSTKQIVGEDLLKQNYPAIYVVGRASDDAPRIIDLRWGNKKHPKLTLVGKGVCFDTGGLDIKTSAGMILMKKDMGGAAHVLGLARMIMQAKLPVCLRVLIPAVENSISGNAYRPGDIIKSRKGLTIEIGNTDAEGRVVLADALTEAVSENPELLIDIATLTGAARVALGTDLPALFANQDDIANDIIQHANKVFDPVWRLPLFQAYRESLETPFADINNNSIDAYGGAITAALFLKEFVPDDIPWVHFDLMAWNLRSRPGRPQGGEAMALRGLFSYLSSRFSKQ